MTNDDCCDESVQFGMFDFAVGDALPLEAWQRFSNRARGGENNADYQAPGYVDLEQLSMRDTEILAWFYNIPLANLGANVGDRRRVLRSFITKSV